MAEGHDEFDFHGVFLRFENITGKMQVPAIDVYLNLPNEFSLIESNTEDIALPQSVGALALFGLKANSTPSIENAGHGLQITLDITEVFNQLRTQSNWNGSQLTVCLHPRRDLKDGSHLCIGRVSLIVE